MVYNRREKDRNIEMKKHMKMYRKDMIAFFREIKGMQPDQYNKKVDKIMALITKMSNDVFKRVPLDEDAHKYLNELSNQQVTAIHMTHKDSGTMSVIVPNHGVFSNLYRSEEFGNLGLLRPIHGYIFTVRSHDGQFRGVMYSSGTLPVPLGQVFKGRIYKHLRMSLDEAHASGRFENGFYFLESVHAVPIEIIHKQLYGESYEEVSSG